MHLVCFLPASLGSNWHARLFKCGISTVRAGDGSQCNPHKHHPNRWDWRAGSQSTHSVHSVGTKYWLSSQILHLSWACSWQRCCTRRPTNILELSVLSTTGMEMPRWREYLSTSWVLCSMPFYRAALNERNNLWLTGCFQVKSWQGIWEV